MPENKGGKLGARTWQDPHGEGVAADGAALVGHGEVVHAALARGVREEEGAVLPGKRRKVPSCPAKGRCYAEEGAVLPGKKRKVPSCPAKGRCYSSLGTRLAWKYCFRGATMKARRRQSHEVFCSLKQKTPELTGRRDEELYTHPFPKHEAAEEHASLSSSSTAVGALDWA